MDRNRLLRGIRNPKLVGRWLNRQFHTRLGRRRYNTGGVDVFNEEWDNLIILDAARYQLFEGWGIGELESRESRGASTIEFLRGNIEGRDLRDTVYVSANPHISQVECQLSEVIGCWGDDGWSSIFDTVNPESVTEKALEAADRNPNKRLVVHYMQPHYPFVFEDASVPSGVTDIWQKASIKNYNLNAEEVRQDYLKNFDLVKEEAEKLVSGLDNRTVITSDHGNLFNERLSPIPIRDWGHPIGVYCDALTRVPWLEVGGSQRKVTKSKSAHASDEHDIKRKLEALGYS